MSAGVLVAGVGNIFLSDDGFGPEVARRLTVRPLPEGVRVVDYGIRGMHLAYDLIDGWDALLIVDTLPRDGAPGDLVVLEVGPEDVGPPAGDGGEFDAHGMEPTSVLAGLGALGGRLPRTYVVGCRPAEVGDGMGLSPPVAAAVDRAVEVVRELLEELCPSRVRPDRTSGGSAEPTERGTGT